MLHGASERGKSGGVGHQPGTRARAAGRGGMATSPAVAGESSVGSISSGAVLAGGSPGIDGEASAGGTDQQSSTSIAAGGKDVSKDDRDLLGLTTRTHPPENDASEGGLQGAAPLGRVATARDLVRFSFRSACQEENLEQLNSAGMLVFWPFGLCRPRGIPSGRRSSWMSAKSRHAGTKY